MKYLRAFLTVTTVAGLCLIPWLAHWRWEAWAIAGLSVVLFILDTVLIRAQRACQWLGWEVAGSQVKAHERTLDLWKKSNRTQGVLFWLMTACAVACWLGWGFALKKLAAKNG